MPAGAPGPPRRSTRGRGGGRARDGGAARTDRALPGDQEVNLFLAPRGDAARYLVAFDSDPLGATAIGNLRVLQDAMPQLLAAAGLSGAEVSYAGDTAWPCRRSTRPAALLEVALAVGLVVLLLLMLFLRAVVAPLYLPATSMLAVGPAAGRANA